MAATLKTWVPRLGTFCRTAAVAVIAGVCRRREIDDINARIAARPVAEQAAITVGVLGALLLISLLAAQFGWIGMLVFWLAVIVVVN